MRLRQRLIQGTLLNLIAVAFNQGSTLAVNILVARILLKQAFGEYAMIQSTLITATGLMQLATGYSAAKYIAEYRTTDPARAGRIMGLCRTLSTVMAFIGALAVLALSPWLASAMLGAPHLTVALRLGTVFILFVSINGYQTGSLSGLEAYDALATAGVAGACFTVPVIALGAWLGGVNGAVIGLGISALVRCGIHREFLRRETRAQGIIPAFRDLLSQEKTLILKFFLPASIAGYYAVPMIWLGSSLLVLQPGGYTEMAQYAVAMSFKSLLLFTPAVINTVASSMLNHLKGTCQGDCYEVLYKSNVVLVFCISLATALLLGLFGTRMLAIFGKNYAAAKPVLLLLLAAGVLEATTTALYQRIQNQGRIWLSFLCINLPLGPMFLILAYLLVPRHGALGLGIANLAMTALSLLGTAFLANLVAKRAAKPTGRF